VSAQTTTAHLNLGPDTGSPDILRGIPQSLQANIRIVHSLGHNLCLPNFFFQIHQSFHHSMLYSIDTAPVK
jgi:hypothetical protein